MNLNCLFFKTLKFQTLGISPLVENGTNFSKCFKKSNIKLLFLPFKYFIFELLCYCCAICLDFSQDFQMLFLPGQFKKNYEKNFSKVILLICSNSTMLLLPTRVAEIVECMCKYVGGISQNLQSVSPY